MNANDLVVGLDPTAFTAIDGAQLAQLVNSATPSSDRGMVIVTTDSTGVPVLPDTTDYPRVENYLWLRLSPLTSSFIVCAWNPTQIYNMGYSNGSGNTVSTNWNPISVGAIPAGSIQGYQLAAGTITPDRLAGGITTSQLVSGSTFLTTSTTPTLADITATSSFSGGFVIAPLAITTGKIAVGGVATTNIAAGACTLAKLDTTGSIYQLLYNSAAGVPAWQTPPQVYTGLANPNAGGSNDGQVVAVNSGAAGTFKYISGMSAAATGQSVSVLGTVAAMITAGAGSAAHGLGAIPTYVRAVLRCTSGELGYSIGDEVNIETCFQHHTSSSFENYPLAAISANATTVYGAFDQSGNPPYISNRGTGVYAAITTTSWTVVIYARL